MGYRALPYLCLSVAPNASAKVIVTAIQDVLCWLCQNPPFRRTTPLTTPGEILVWWELRRIAYNLIVDIAGICCCLQMFAVILLLEVAFGVDCFPDPPIFALFIVVLYGFLANLCYTVGWVIEIRLPPSTSPGSTSFGETAFAAGTVFSVLLTLAPAVMAWVSVVAHGIAAFL